MNFLRANFLCAVAVGAVLCAGVAFGQAGSPQQFADLGEVKLENGASIHGCKLGYRTLGTLNTAKSNAILFPTWFTGTTKDLLTTVSDKGYIDPGPYYWIFVDAIGNGVSCSPSNSAPQHGTDFPEFTIRDMVESQHRFATEKLGLTHVHAVMGVSMGGMQTFQWMVSYPEFMDVAVPIVGSPQSTSYDKLLWNTELAAMAADPEYMDGKYSANPKLKAVGLIHNLNLTTPEARVKETPTAGFDGFLEGLEKKGIGDTDANNWRWQLGAILKQDVSVEGSLDVAAAKVKAKVLVVNARQDHIVNPIPAIEFAPKIRAKLLILEGNCGHLAPGCEAETVRSAVAKELR